MGQEPIPILKKIKNMSSNQKQMYNIHKDGFCFLPSLFSQAEATSAREGLYRVINEKYNTGIPPENRFWNLGDSPNAIIKIDKPHICDRSVWNLVTKPKFGKALALITNAKMIQVWHSQVVWKPKSDNTSGNAGWHRDAQYWPFWSEEGLYTAWIALSDVSMGSGPVRFIVGSNKWDSLEGLDFFDKNIDSQDEVLDAQHKNRKIVHSTLKTGEVSIHTSLTYHSSIENKENNPRVGMVVHFCTDRAMRIPLVGENENYLDQIKDTSIAPIIYGDKIES